MMRFSLAVTAMLTLGGCQWLGAATDAALSLWHAAADPTTG